MSTHREFGGWSLDRERLCLVWQDEDGREVYEVDLEQCRTSAAMLDWIMQIAGKLWATDTVLAGLVHAFDHFLDPQGTLCSFGRSRGPVNVRKILEAGFGR